MDEKEMQAKIRKHNEEVRYNQSLSSWITDIIACLIFFPMIIMVVYRRGKYKEYKKNF